MKKTIMTALSIALATSAFAITEAQKTTFANKVQEEFIPANKANDALGANKMPWMQIVEKIYADNQFDTATTPVAEWAISTPIEYSAFVKENGGMFAAAIVRYYIDTNNLLDWRTCSAEQSAAIYDHRKQYDDAMSDKSKYDELKSANFVSGGIVMSNHKIAALAKKHADVETYESMFTKQQLAERFGDYIYVLSEAAAVAQTKKEVYEKFASVEASFLSMTSVSEVSENWSKFIGMLDAAWMRYERAVKVGNEQ